MIEMLFQDDSDYLFHQSKKESDLLENVQIEVGRIITGLRCNSSRQKLYHELGWETLENRRNKHKLI
jgi:hypothetical protein